MRFLTKIILIVLFLGATLFAKDVATVTALNGKAFVERDGQKVEVSLGDKLQEKDRVVTDDKSKMQIIFEDETIVTIGKSSNFSISEYMFEESKEPVAKFAMLKGAMRTITGKIGEIAPDKFSVTTKTALIGIRGTNFSVLVGEDGSHQVFCTYGAISVTIDGKEFIVKQGFVIVVSPDGKIEVKEFSSKDLKDMKEKNFGKSKAKKGDASEDETASNDGQLDNTTDDEADIIVQDISDTLVDADQTSSYDGPTDDSVIAGYAMNNALYEGTYTTTSNDSTLPDSGVATLGVDFGNDEALLTLNPSGTAPTDKAIYDDAYTGLTSNTFGASVTSAGSGDPVGDMSGKFYGDTGNTAKGDFNYKPNGMQPEEAIGTFEVTTEQELH